MWCHLALAVPFLSMGLFFMLPWQIALPIYLPLAVISGLLYRTLIRDMRKPPKVGPEALLNATAIVLERLPSGSGGQYLVQVGAERWLAQAGRDLRQGDITRVVGVKGLRLVLDGIPEAPSKVVNSGMGKST